MTQRQNKPTSHNASARHSGGNAGQDEIRYFDLITTGIGYLNRVRKVMPNSGNPYWACDINALVGESSANKKPAYRLYQCSIVGNQAFEALDLIEEAMDGNDKATVLIGFRLGDSRPDSFNVQKDDGRGNSRQETRYCNKARLLKIMTASVNKIPVELPQHDQPDQIHEDGTNDFGNEGDGQYQGDGMQGDEHFDDQGQAPQSSERQSSARNGSGGQRQDDGYVNEETFEHRHDRAAHQPSRSGALGPRQGDKANVGQAPRQPARQSQSNGFRTRAHA